MKKEQISQRASKLAGQDELSREELNSAYKSGSKDKKSDEVTIGSITMVNMLYYIGCVVILAGMFVLLFQHIQPFAELDYVVFNLGLAIVLYLIGVAMIQEKKWNKFGQFFFLMSALFMPYAIFMAFANGGWNVATYHTLSLVFSIVLCFYLGAYLIFRKDALLLLSIIFATLLACVFIAALVERSDLAAALTNAAFLQYLLFFTGISYAILGFIYSRVNDKDQLSVTLYVLGLLAYLTGSFMLVAWDSDSINLAWLLLFPAILLVSIGFSVYLQRKALLFINLFFLVWYIWKLSLHYFASDYALPLALVLIGAALMIAGYSAVKIKNRYMEDVTSDSNSKSIT